MSGLKEWILTRFCGCTLRSPGTSHISYRDPTSCFFCELDLNTRFNECLLGAGGVSRRLPYLSETSVKLRSILY
jgi:hypothetical protein